MLERSVGSFILIISLNKEFRSLLFRDYHWKRNLLLRDPGYSGGVQDSDMSGEVRSRKGGKGGGGGGGGKKGSE